MQKDTTTGVRKRGFCLAAGGQNRSPGFGGKRRQTKGLWVADDHNRPRGGVEQKKKNRLEASVLRTTCEHDHLEHRGVEAGLLPLPSHLGQRTESGKTSPQPPSPAPKRRHSRRRTAVQRSRIRACVRCCRWPRKELHKRNSRRERSDWSR